MDVDLRTSTITFHVVFAGPGPIKSPPPTRGRQTADSPGNVSLFLAGEDRVTIATCAATRADALLGLKVALQAVLSPAKPKASAVERLLLSAADAVVFVPDGDALRSERALSQLLTTLDKMGRNLEELPLLVHASAESVPVECPSGSKWRLRKVSGDLCSFAELGAMMETAVEGLLDRYRGLEMKMGAEQGRGVLATLSKTATSPTAVPRRSSLDCWILGALVAGGAAAAFAVAFLAV